MSIQMKNGCLVYYGNLIGYQAKNQTEVTVDPQFRREELESWLARRGLVPRWEEGVYERLSNEGFRVSDSSPELQSCRIWQLKPGTPIQMRFIGLMPWRRSLAAPHLNSIMWSMMAGFRTMTWKSSGTNSAVLLLGRTVSRWLSPM